jgi:hypothetical protein
LLSSGFTVSGCQKYSFTDTARKPGGISNIDLKINRLCFNPEPLNPEPEYLPINSNGSPRAKLAGTFQILSKVDCALA